MNPIFFEQVFQKERKINPEALRRKISNKYKQYNLDTQYTFEEMLFILDEQCESNRCDRDVAKQIFNQSVSPDNKVSLNQMIFKYVENIQTSKLCLIREHKAIQALERKLQSLKGSKNCFVHIKIIQASVYARYSSIPSFSYRILPSDIPPVTVVNSLHPILNHEYTLKMENEQFQIVFYESGIQIGVWKWPDSQYLSSQKNTFEHHRNVVLENLSFELQLKYLPKNADPKSVQFIQQLKQRQNRKQNQSQAFKNLCYFEPFSDKEKITNELEHNHGKIWDLTERVIQCLPFVADHLRNLYYSLIVLIIVECFASIFWSMEFLDISLAFYLISSIYDQAEFDLGMQLWGSMMAFLLLIIKSLWGASTTSEKGHYFYIFLILAIIMKILCIFFVWVSAVRKEQIRKQRIDYFYSGVDPQLGNKKEEQSYSEDNESIFY